MAKKRYVKLEQGRYNIALSRDVANFEAKTTGQSCLYCRDYFPSARKRGNESYVCKDCIERSFYR